MLRNMRGSVATLVCIFGLTVAVCLPAMADTSTDNGTFKTAGQNMWGANNAPNTFGVNEGGGVGFGSTVNLTVGDCSIACAQAQGGVAGSLGVSVNGQASGGTVAATVDFNSVITVPHTFQHDTTFDPAMALTLGTATLNTNGPKLTAATGLNGSLGIYAQAGGCIASNCAGVGVILAGSPLNPPPGTPVPPIPASFSKNLFAVGGTLPVAGAGNKNVHAGASTNIGAIADLGIALSAALGVSPAGGWNTPSNFPFSLGGSFSVANGVGTFNATFSQDFVFNPNVTGELFVEQTGQTALCYSNGTCDAIKTPHTGNLLTIDPEYFAAGDLTNDTTVSFGANFGVNLLSGDVSVDGKDASFGPLATFGSNQISLPSATLLDSKFALGGFQKIDGRQINITLAQSTPTPEPGSLALLVSGLVGAFGTMRFRARRRA